MYVLMIMKINTGIDEHKMEYEGVLPNGTVAYWCMCVRLE